jgi:hypothetical protein
MDRRIGISIGFVLAQWARSSRRPQRRMVYSPRDGIGGEHVIASDIYWAVAAAQGSNLFDHASFTCGVARTGSLNFPA